MKPPGRDSPTPSTPVPDPAAAASGRSVGARNRPSSNLALYLFVFALSLASSAGIGAFIPQHVPKTHDEFAYLLAGQTFADFRLTNPTPPLWWFFETQHILLQPSYMAKFPPGHGMAIAVGYWLGDPIRGVWLESALFAVSIAWMLRGFFARRWALLGALLAILQFGATHYWTQTFWGGSLAAFGGALVFGGARRLGREPRVRDAAFVGFGVVILMMTRPFEGLLVCLVPATLIALQIWRQRARFTHMLWPRVIAPAAAVVFAGGAFLAYYNHRVTGSAFQLPYREYETQYSGMPLFVWESPRSEPAFRNEAVREFYRRYVVPHSRWNHPPLLTFFQRSGQIVIEYLGPVLAGVSLLGFAIHPALWSRFALASLGLGLFAVAACYWFSDSHYQAPAVSLYVFLAVAAIRTVCLKLSRPLGAVVLTLLAVAQAATWVEAQQGDRRLTLHRASSNRENVVEGTRSVGGRHLIFVRRIPPYDVHASYVFNDADLARSPVVWAWDRGPAENARLLAHFPDRIAVLLIERNRQIEFVPYRIPPTAPANH